MVAHLLLTLPLLFCHCFQATSSEKSLNAFVKLYATSQKSVLK